MPGAPTSGTPRESKGSVQGPVGTGSAGPVFGENSF